MSMTQEPPMTTPTDTRADGEADALIAKVMRAAVRKSDLDADKALLIEAAEGLGRLSRQLAEARAVTDEMVEAAARALCECAMEPLDAISRNKYMGDARAALTAAHAAAMGTTND
jgi:malic enzyme